MTQTKNVELSDLIAGIEQRASVIKTPEVVAGIHSLHEQIKQYAMQHGFSELDAGDSPYTFLQNNAGDLVCLGLDGHGNQIVRYAQADSNQGEAFNVPLIEKCVTRDYAQIAIDRESALLLGGAAFLYTTIAMVLGEFGVLAPVVGGAMAIATAYAVNHSGVASRLYEGLMTRANGQLQSVANDIGQLAEKIREPNFAKVIRTMPQPYAKDVTIFLESGNYFRQADALQEIAKFAG